MATKKADIPLEEMNTIATTEEDGIEQDKTTEGLDAVLDKIAGNPFSEMDDGETSPTDETAAPALGDAPATEPDVADQDKTATDSLKKPRTSAKKKPTAKKKSAAKTKVETAPDVDDSVGDKQQELDDVLRSLDGDMVAADETVPEMAADTEETDALEPAGVDEWELKAAEHLSAEAQAALTEIDTELENDAPVSGGLRISTRKNAFGGQTSPAAPEGKKHPAKLRANEILTIKNGRDVVLPGTREDELWHEFKNSQLTHRILTGRLAAVEPLENRNILPIIEYKNQRVIIPLSEMGLDLPEGRHRLDLDVINKASSVLNSMLDCDIDFVVRGFDQKEGTVGGSRKEAMRRKRKTFFMRQDEQGEYLVKEGRVVEARVLAVTEKVVYVEVLGVETAIVSQMLAWEWVGDARELFSVRDQILVRITKIERGAEQIAIEADVKSLTPNTVAENLKKIKTQGKYAGVITDVYRGVVFIRLDIGVNAIAHSCMDRRRPGKRDTVSLVVTHIDQNRNVALGLITRIIKQNI